MCAPTVSDTWLMRRLEPTMRGDGLKAFQLRRGGIDRNWLSRTAARCSIQQNQATLCSASATGFSMGDYWRMCIRRLRLWRRKRRDQEDAIVPTSSSHGETQDVLEGYASSIADCPDVLTPMRSHSSCSGHLGVEAVATSAASGPSSLPFSSSRIQSLSERRNDFGSELEFQIESSKRTWTETSGATSNYVDEDELDDEEEQGRTRVAFEKLKEHPEWGPFFRREPYDLEIGEKIAEGGQAVIFEALGTNKHENDRSFQGKTRLVAKVFKKGFSLEDLQRLWPPELASAAMPYRYSNRPSSGLRSGYINSLGGHGLCFAVGAQLLDDGRFAFIFDRFWGDFRTLINRQMLKNNGAPPFSLIKTYRILRNIAEGMVMLHKFGLLHKDLKAANVLALRGNLGHGAYIADFESSVGIAGTGFWRAPEVLLALKNGSLTDETFTQQSDVYSYAMTCYEFLTGRIPFEDHPPKDYDIILRGKRPLLPDNIDPFYKDLVSKCWHQDPLQRPSFQEIVADFRTTADDVEFQLRISRDMSDPRKDLTRA